MTFFDYPGRAVPAGTDDRPAGERPAEPEVFLPDASEEDWSALLRNCRRRRFERGETIIDPGGSDRSLYLVIDGAAEVLIPGRRPGRYRHAGTVRSGRVLGEVSFFDGDARSALVRAVSTVDVAELSPADFDALALERPALSRQILFDLGRILARRLRATQRPGSE